MNELAQGIYNRINLAVNTAKGLAQMNSWLTKYTRLDDRAFSFDDHEMQIDIVNDTNARVAVQKCSQIGLSELSARKCLGIAAMTKGTHIQYVMPTRTMATKFSSSRLSTIIETSPMLSNMASKTVKGTELKKIGSSFIHMGGTSGSATGAISVPAKYVIMDEVDFSDQTVLGKYESRLKHTGEDEHHRKGTIIKFSTPTVPDFGINIDFKDSDQKHYNVRCQHCEHDFAPDYFKDVVIPGFTKKIEDLAPADIKSGTLDIMNAYMACPECGGDVWDALCDPKRRHWVPKYPENIISGYQIHPWDVPNVNSIPSIMMQMPGYEVLSDFYNFTIGIPWVDNENSFNLERLESTTPCDWIDDGSGGGFVMGVDIGKTSHITVGRRNVDGTEEVNYLERYTVAGDNEALYNRIVEVAKLFKVQCTVIDAAPDFTTALEVIKKLPLGTVYACEYTRNRSKTLEAIQLPTNPEDETEFVAKVYRTGTLQDFLRAHNAGRIRYFPKNTSPVTRAEFTELFSHLKNTKKLRITNAEGHVEERFVNTGDDHYTHSINYMRIAGKIAGIGLSIGFSFKPCVSKFKTKTKSTTTKISNLI